MYTNLRDALKQATNQIVIAEDVTSVGQKRFLVGDLPDLHSQYSRLQQRHWYECLVENKASRIFLDVESISPVNIEDIVNFFTKTVQLQFKTVPIFEIIDSSGPNKFSWHVLCTNIYLKNVYHVGAFVRKTVLAMQGKHGVEAVDTAVYTKNRMFRIKGSTKFGSDRVLTHSKPWYELLVQSPGPVNVLDCLEIDKSEPHSTSAHPSLLFQLDVEIGKWVRLDSRPTSNSSKTETYCKLLSPILNWLDKNKNAHIKRHQLSMTSFGHYQLPCDSTECGIAQRCHKSNNIRFEVHINNQKVFQKCYDADCTGKKLEILVPTELWDGWNLEWQKIVLPE